MTEKQLPPGTYAVRVLIVGAADIGGSILIGRWMIPATPELLADASVKGIDVLMPKQIDFIPAGAWIVVGVDYQPGEPDGCVQADQILVDRDVGPAEFRDYLLTILPPSVELMGTNMLRHIGIDAITFQRAERPALLN